MLYLPWLRSLRKPQPPLHVAVSSSLTGNISHTPDMRKIIRRGFYDLRQINLLVEFPQNEFRQRLANKHKPRFHAMLFLSRMIHLVSSYFLRYRSLTSISLSPHSLGHPLTFDFNIKMYLYIQRTILSAMGSYCVTFPTRICHKLTLYVIKIWFGWRRQS